MRSKYGTFPEYHTSADDLNFVTPGQLKKSVQIVKDIIEEFMSIKIPITKIFCEPHLTKYGLYRSLSTKNFDLDSRNILNFLSYCDGKKDLVIISKKINLKIKQINRIFKILKQKKIINEIT